MTTRFERVIQIQKKIIDNYEDLNEMKRDYESFKIDLIREHETSRKYQHQKDQVQSEIRDLGMILYRVCKGCESAEDLNVLSKLNLDK